MLGLEIPWWIQVLNLGWFLLVLGLGPLSKRWLEAHWDWLLLVWEDLGSCDTWSRPAIHMDKPPLTTWVGMYFGWDWVSGVSRVGKMVLKKSYMAPTCWLHGSMRGGFKKGTVASAHLSVWEKAIHQLLPWFQTLQFLPLCHPITEAQREWFWVSPCVGSFRGTALDSRNFFYWLNTHWCL